MHFEIITVLVEKMFMFAFMGTLSGNNLEALVHIVKYWVSYRLHRL